MIIFSGKLTTAALTLAALVSGATYTPVTIPTNNNIQTGLINTFPTGNFVASNSLATPFTIPAAAGACGPSSNAPCNFYDAFGFSGTGQSITMNVSVPNATDVYTLMNAYDPAGGQTLATITFQGSGGAKVTFPLIGGQVIRDFYQGEFTNTLTNGVPGVEAMNAFTCVDPAACLGSGGSGNVQTGLQGNYVVDEQHFSLGNTFAGQTLTQIIVTDTYNGSNPILLGVTVGTLGPPTINISGVVPVFSATPVIQPGSWGSIYGANLASETATWDGTFPTSLGGTTVAVNGKSAYLWFVSSGQINFQAPDDTTTGSVPVTVTTSAGTASSTVTLAPEGPSFSLLNAKYPAAIVVTPGSPGNSGGGYDIIGPAGAFSYPTRPVMPGEIVQIYGVGFGPTMSPVPAGKSFSGVAASVTNPQVTIGGVPAQVQFAGIIEAGLYQLNITVPNVSSGDQPLQASIGGATTQSNVFITIK